MKAITSTFLIDANVILDILNNENNSHTEWSAEILNKCSAHGELAINQIIFSEVSVKFKDIRELNYCLTDFLRLSLPWEAGFIAGKAYHAYRRNKGNKTSPLPDFYIGAHALCARLSLVTRDCKRYRTYFPKLKLISPE